MDRFWAKVDKSGDCWVWTAALVDGYGTIKVDGKMIRAHRLSYEMAFGPIPAGAQINHRCGNRACVRPDHLYAGTHSMNMLDSVGHGTHRCSRVTHCPKGHEYTDENTYASKGKRACRTCKLAKVRERRMRQRS